MIFSASLSLTNVLYLHGFSFNLVSVTKLTASLNCSLTFTNKTCVIQDSSTLKKIGSAEARDGLYVLDSSILPVINSITDVTATSWHSRLGHLSYDKLSLLHKLFPYIVILKCNKSCEICPLAKQKKLSFPINHINLLQIDIWGPNSIVSINGHRYYLARVDDFTRHTWIFFFETQI